MPTDTDTSILLHQYKKDVDSKIQQNFSAFYNKDKLRDACEYALMNGGKRLRPILTLMIAKALNLKTDVTQAALTVEFFHTASLVADDLPCMDDDDERRQKPSVHKVYGEGVALLVSYALIAAGYSGIVANGQILKDSKLAFSHQSDRLVSLALENATYNTGLNGATGGQFLDIFPPDLTLETLRTVIHKKTVSLFEIAFVFGWLFGGGSLELLPLVKKGASHFGTAFQIADDLDDITQDVINGRKVNVAAIFGRDVAKDMFHEETASYLHTLKELGLDSNELKITANWLIEQLP